MCMSHDVICDLSGSTIFFNFISQTTRFSKKKNRMSLNITCFDFLWIFWIFPTLRSIKRYIIKNVYFSWSKVLSILVRFQCTVNFLDITSKNAQISNFINIRPVAADFHALRHTDRRQKGRKRDRTKNGRTDMRELIVAFRNFANSPKISVPVSQWHSACPKYILFFILYREFIAN
jgi:hypothetical protein